MYLPRRCGDFLMRLRARLSPPVALPRFLPNRSVGGLRFTLHLVFFLVEAVGVDGLVSATHVSSSAFSPEPHSSGQTRDLLAAQFGNKALSDGNLRGSASAPRKVAADAALRLGAHRAVCFAQEASETA